MKDDGAYIKHIIDELNFILKETDGLTLDSLLKNETLKRALLRSLEVVGEATKNLSAEFRNLHPEVQWKEIAGLRDKLIHSYFGVDWNIVWDIVKNKIPELREKLKKLS